MSEAFDASFAAWCERRKAEQLARRRARAVRMRHLRVKDHLPMARVWLRGPKWQRGFSLQHLASSAVYPDGDDMYKPTQKFWWYDFAVDVRELVCEPLQFDRVAMWADPRERL